jgi:hypothetical protein
VTWVPNTARTDEAADAAQFLSRFGYVLIALGVPAGVVLHELAIFVLYPVAIASFVLAALIDPPGNVIARIRAAFAQPIVALSLALIAWAGVSVLWTPFSIAAGQHLLKLALWLVSLMLALTTTRGHAKATDLYLFPFGLVLGMIAMFAVFVASRYGADIPRQRILDGAIVLVTTLFPVIGALAARGRNGWGRLLFILAFVYVYALGSTALMIALLVGFATLSFGVADLRRTTRDLAIGGAALMALGPLATILTAEITRGVMNTGVGSLGSSFTTLARAQAMVIHEKLLLITGHGFEALVRAVQSGLFPPVTPSGQLFAIWYELGVVGAGISAAMIWFGFRRIGEAPPRLAPFLAAALACNLTLGALLENFGDMLWTVSLGVACIAADVAARSLYRTTRPSAAGLALF